MAKVIETHIDQLIPDDHNFNKHTEFGMHLLEKSVGEFGLGRSIVLDKNNRIISGNGITETAANLDLTKVIVVETEGRELVAVRRKDVDLDTKKGREMALADNATAKADLDFDAEQIDMMAERYDFDPGDWGVNIETPDIEPEDEHKDLSGNVTSLFQIAIDCDNEAEQERIYNQLKDKYKCRILTL